LFGPAESSHYPPSLTVPGRIGGRSGSLAHGSGYGQQQHPT
jgi:hypothetical protein